MHNYVLVTVSAELASSANRLWQLPRLRTVDVAYEPVITADTTASTPAARNPIGGNGHREGRCSKKIGRLSILAARILDLPVVPPESRHIIQVAPILRRKSLSRLALQCGRLKSTATLLGNGQFGRFIDRTMNCTSSRDARSALFCDRNIPLPIGANTVLPGGSKAINFTNSSA